MTPIQITKQIIEANEISRKNWSPEGYAKLKASLLNKAKECGKTEKKDIAAFLTLIYSKGSALGFAPEARLAALGLIAEI